MNISINQIYQLLRSDGSIIVNKNLARNIGIQEAIFFSELISKYIYFSEKGELKDGYFFNTVENLEYDTCLSDYQQRKCIQKLREIGLISTKLKGIPPKRYFKITDNIDLLLSQIFNNSRIESKETKDLNLKKFKNLYYNNTKFNNTNSNKFLSKDKNKGENKFSPNLNILQKEAFPLIDLWNRLTKKIKIKNKPSIHKIPKSPNDNITKTIIGITNTIIELKAGCFFKQSKLKNKIKDTSILRKKFTNEEIKNIIRNYFKLYKIGYSYNSYEVNLDKLAKNMKDFFYNPRTNLSYFLTIAENPVKLISDKYKENREKDLEQIPEKIIELYKPLFSPLDWNNYEYQIFNNILDLNDKRSDLQKLHEDYYSEYDNPFNRYFSNFEKFSIIYIEYLRNKFDFVSTGLSFGHLNSYGAVWIGFIKYLLYEYGIILFGHQPISGFDDDKLKNILLNRRKTALLNIGYKESDFEGNFLKNKK